MSEGSHCGGHYYLLAGGDCPTNSRRQVFKTTFNVRSDPTFQHSQQVLVVCCLMATAGGPGRAAFPSWTARDRHVASGGKPVVKVESIGLVASGGSVRGEIGRRRDPAPALERSRGRKSVPRVLRSEARARPPLLAQICVGCRAFGQGLHGPLNFLLRRRLANHAP